MKRVLLSVAYDGTNYHGWQLQPNGITIEEVLNKTLSELLSESITVSGASRTDAGVHAMCNLAVFDTNARIPAEKIPYALNQRLPEDIRINGAKEVEENFHPRYAKTIKTYEYKIWNDRFPNPLNSKYTYFCYYQLDIEAMREASLYLVGEHDFKSFCSVGSQAETTVREIVELNIVEEEPKTANIRSYMTEKKSAQIERVLRADEGGRCITIRVSGYGFLYNMVRIIAGTLMEVGKGNMTPKQVLQALEACDRAAAGPTAPAKGLILSDYQIIE